MHRFFAGCVHLQATAPAIADKERFYPLGFAIFCNVLVYYGMSWPYLYHKHPNVQQEMRSNMSQNIHTSKIRYPSVECVGANYYDVCARLLQQNMSACHSGSETTSPHLSLRSSKKNKKIIAGDQGRTKMSILKGEMVNHPIISYHLICSAPFHAESHSALEQMVWEWSPL